MRQADATPALIGVQGESRGYSGGPTGDSGSRYALRILGGGIHLNGGNPGADSWRQSYLGTLRRILGDLGEALDREDGTADGLPVSRADAEALLDNRPSEGWRSWEEVRSFLGDQGKFDALRPCLCLRSWVDKGVIKPNLWAGSGGIPCRSRLDGTALHGTRPDDSLDRSPDLERTWEWGWPASSPNPTEGRAPVNLAWARHRRPVLIALLSNLRGTWLDESQGSSAQTLLGPRPADVYAVTDEALIANTWSEDDECHLTAASLMACTSPLATWQEWNAFCDSLAFSGDADAPQAKRDLLKAQFNPNADLNKFNPNGILWKLVDKSDVTVPTTEFSLFDVQEREVSSLGRILDASGRLLASRTVTVTLAPPRVARVSTQREFACEDLGVADLDGDEQGVRMPGYVVSGRDAFVSESLPELASTRTWGHRLDVRSRYPSSWMSGASNGSSLQTYPEPCTDGGSGLTLNPADYDGYLQLATLETPEDAYYGAPAPRRLTSLGSFDDAFDLDKALGDPACVPDTAQATYAWGAPPALPELGFSILRSDHANTLYPDGVYSCLGRAPAFRDRDNTPPLHGTMSFWVKNDDHTAFKHDESRGRLYLSRTNYGFDPDVGLSSQIFLVGYSRNWRYWSGTPMLSASFEMQREYSGSESLFEHGFYINPSPFQSPRWRLITFAWDFQGADGAACGEFLLDDGNASPDQRASNNHYDFDTIESDPTVATDLTVDDRHGAHLMTLGPWDRAFYEGGCGDNFGRGADATLDEFAVWDFGNGTCGEDGPGRTLALHRYREGRYYREDSWPDGGLLGPLSDRRAGQYLSAPLRLPAGSRIQKVHWTWLRPAALPDDYAEIALTRDEPGPGGWEYLWEEGRSRSVRAPGWTPERQRWDLGRSPPSPFRLQAVFRRRTPLEADVPLLESPVLDDLSVVYTLPGGGLRSWEEK